ncbi:MAG: hypothetical protein ABJA37_02705 [Ferruginibacter sp.]
MRFYVIFFLVFVSLTTTAQQKDLTVMDEADSTKGASGYLQVATTFGNSYFSSKIKNIDASQQSNNFVFTPSLSYFHKSGPGLTAAAYRIKDGSNSGFYQFSISPSYSYTKSENIEATVNYTRYFVKKGYEAIASPFKNEFFGQVNLKKPWLQPGLSSGFANGSFTEYHKIDTVLNGTRRIFTDTVNTKLSDFTVSVFVQHEFVFDALLNKNDEISITPQLLINAGKSVYTETHQNPFLSRLQKKGTSGRLKHAGNTNQQTSFEIQSLAFSTDVYYSIGKFGINPQLYLDYYLPKTTDKRFTSVYSLQLSYNF